MTIGMTNAAPAGGGGGDWTQITMTKTGDVFENVDGHMRALKDTVIRWHTDTLGGSSFPATLEVYFPKGVDLGTTKITIPVTGARIHSSKQLDICNYLEIPNSLVFNSYSVYFTRISGTPGTDATGSTQTASVFSTAFMVYVKD